MINMRKKLIIAATAAVVCFTITGLVLSAKGSDRNPLQEKLELGEQYISGLEYEQALAVYQEALMIEPNSAEARLGILNVYMNTGKEEEALLFYEETLARLDDSETEDNDDDVASLYMYVQQLYGDNPEQLLNILAKGYDATNGDVSIQNAFGQNAQAYIYALLQKGEIQKAQSFLQENKKILSQKDYDSLQTIVNKAKQDTTEVELAANPVVPVVENVSYSQELVMENAQKETQNSTSQTTGNSQTKTGAENTDAVGGNATTTPEMEVAEDDAAYAVYDPTKYTILPAIIDTDKIALPANSNLEVTEPTYSLCVEDPNRYSQLIGTSDEQEELEANLVEIESTYSLCVEDPDKYSKLIGTTVVEEESEELEADLVEIEPTYSLCVEDPDKHSELIETTVLPEESEKQEADLVEIEPAYELCVEDPDKDWSDFTEPVKNYVEEDDAEELNVVGGTTYFDSGEMSIQPAIIDIDSSMAVKFE